MIWRCGAVARGLGKWAMRRRKGVIGYWNEHTAGEFG